MKPKVLLRHLCDERQITSQPASGVQPMLIDTSDQLQEFCARHQGTPILAFDSEFVRERTYFPRLEIMQILADGEIAVIDCQTIEDLEPLWQLMCNDETEKVVHSGVQDMELILQESQRLPRPIFDTQIVASLLGYGSQCGYSRLVYQLIGRKVPKGETFSDWSHRPLRPEQIRYAEADVQYLIELREVLGKKLRSSGREQWVYEECSHLSDPETFLKHPPEKCFLRIKGRSGLDPQSLSVLRSLAHWRELEARKRNHPPNRVVQDHVLLSVAKSAPTNIEDLKRQRGLHANEVQRCGVDILAAIQEGFARAETDPVEVPNGNRPRPDEEDDAVFKLLSAVLQIKSEQAQVAPSVLANSQELRALLTGFRQNRLNGVPLLKGWRYDLAGKTLLSVLEGRVALRFDPERGSLVLEESHA